MIHEKYVEIKIKATVEIDIDDEDQFSQKEINDGFETFKSDLINEISGLLPINQGVFTVHDDEITIKNIKK